MLNVWLKEKGMTIHGVIHMMEKTISCNERVLIFYVHTRETNITQLEWTCINDFQIVL